MQTPEHHLQAHNARAAREADDHQLFFAGAVAGSVIEIDAEEAHHVTSVLRLSVGDVAMVTDGTGVIYRARFGSVTRDGMRAEILERIRCAAPFPALTLCVGLPDRDAFERILEEVTPLGVACIVPLKCRHCQKPWWDRSWDKLEPRFRRKMIVAVKQSRNPYLPEIKPPTDFGAALAGAEGALVIADQEGGPLGGRLNQAAAVTAFVGPPGGFSPQEIASLEARSALRVSVAPYRLRTELAATVTCAQLRSITP